jgi:hypothetical protein
MASRMVHKAKVRACWNDVLYRPVHAIAPRCRLIYTGPCFTCYVRGKLETRIRVPYAMHAWLFGRHQPSVGNVVWLYVSICNHYPHFADCVLLNRQDTEIRIREAMMRSSLFSGGLHSLATAQPRIYYACYIRFNSPS